MELHSRFFGLFINLQCRGKVDFYFFAWSFTRCHPIVCLNWFPLYLMTRFLLYFIKRNFRSSFCNWLYFFISWQCFKIGAVQSDIRRGVCPFLWAFQAIVLLIAFLLSKQYAVRLCYCTGLTILWYMPHAWWDVRRCGEALWCQTTWWSTSSRFLFHRGATCNVFTSK